MRHDTERSEGQLWDGDDDQDGPTVLVDPELQAVCLPRWRAARGTQVPCVEAEISTVDGTPLEIFDRRCDAR